MALVRYSEIIQGIRGSIAGLTWSANRSGSYVKKLATPVKKRTLAQSSKRAWFTQVSGAYANLTPAQVAQWDAFALSPPEIDYDPWGDQRFLTGSAWHMRINMRRLEAGQAIANNPPASTPSTPPTDFTLTIYRTGAVGVDSVFDYGTGDFVGRRAMLKLSLANSAVRTVQTSGYYVVWLDMVSVPGPQIITAEVDAVFGNVQVGQKMFGELRAQQSSGIRSVGLDATALVLEEP